MRILPSRDQYNGASFRLTSHALSRYAHRVARVSRAEARRILSEGAKSAVLLKERAPGGRLRWAIPDLGVELVCRDVRGVYVVVTILTEES